MAESEIVKQLLESAEKQDFEGLLKFIRENQGKVAESVRPGVLVEILKKATKDRLVLSYVDGVGFGQESFDKSLVRLEKLISFQPGTMVLSRAFGLGKVAKVDYFYRRVTVDFETKRGHQFTYAAATDMLNKAPEDHILMKRYCDRDGFDKLFKDKPGDFVVEVLKSYGEMSIVRLEDVCVANGFVKSVNWKSFWNRARGDLQQNALVEVPTKRTEPIRLRTKAEDYKHTWLTEFKKQTDPKLILASVIELEENKKLEQPESEEAKAEYEETKSAVADRLAFAVTAARKVDDALYSRLACKVTKLGLLEPSASEMRAYLWERNRFIKAAEALPAREVGAMVAFLACDDEAKAKLYEAIPKLCFTAVAEVVSQFGKEPECRAAVGNYLKQPKAPATLVTLVVGKYEQFKDWAELPSLIYCLTHAIALGEGRQGGETLRMQNIVRRLFGDKKWLEKMFGWLSPDEKALIFERFQASIAWDPSTHHATVIRMTKIVPELETHLMKVEKKREYARITSFRSFGLKKQEYLKLINEDMPANVKRIEFAKSYGDLSENAEYQYAKDEQRALMHKQTVMQADLEAVKPGDFSDATTDEVMPGVTVVATARDGEKRWTILGEWDNDLDRGIISSKTRVAQNLLGKRVGDNFELTDADGVVSFAVVKEILPLSDEIREWMKLPPGIQI